GGGAWDNEGNGPRVAQLDTGNHTIQFAADPGYALSLNSFDFAHTAETAGSSTWDLSLTDSDLNVVWQSTVVLDNQTAGTTLTVAPAFVGGFGQSYTLAFARTASTYDSNGRHGIDNLN